MFSPQGQTFLPISFIISARYSFNFLVQEQPRLSPPMTFTSTQYLNWEMYNIKRFKGVSLTDHPLLLGESKEKCLSAVRANLKGLESKSELSQLKKISEWGILAGCCHKWSEQFQIKMQAQQLAEENNESIVEAPWWQISKQQHS